MTDKKVFFGYLHSFRGFAILNIVIVHAIVGTLVAVDGKLDMANPVAIINEVLFHDNTLYFAVISGLLFSSILFKKGYRHFYVNKLKYVVTPYVLITAVVAVFKTLPPSQESTEPVILLYFNNLFRDLLYGKANPLFWYMPVLFFLYLATPLLNYFMHLHWKGLS